MGFKIHRGICSCGCGKEGIVCVAKGYIQRCNYRIKQEKKGKSLTTAPRIFVPKTEEEKQEIFDKLKEKYESKKLRQKPLKRTPLKKKFPKKTGEGLIFNHIWQTREHKCEVCGDPIKRVDGGVRMFSHVVSKGSHPELRLDEENILLKGDGLFGNCDCHDKWEHRVPEMRDIEMWKPIFLLHDALIRKANVTNKGKE